MLTASLDRQTDFGGQAQHSFQSERISKAQMNANQRNISDLRYLARNNIIVPYSLDTHKNSTVLVNVLITMPKKIHSTSYRYCGLKI